MLITLVAPSGVVLGGVSFAIPVVHTLTAAFIASEVLDSVAQHLQLSYGVHVSIGDIVIHKVPDWWDGL